MCVCVCRGGGGEVKQGHFTLFCCLFVFSSFYHCLTCFIFGTLPDNCVKKTLHKRHSAVGACLIADLDSVCVEGEGVGGNSSMSNNFMSCENIVEDRVWMVALFMDGSMDVARNDLLQ